MLHDKLNQTLLARFTPKPGRHALLPELFVLGALATSVTMVPLMWVDSVATLAVGMFVAGLFFAPTLITAMGLVENIVPAAKLTEGLTWMITGLGMGVALGAVLGGWVIDTPQDRKSTRLNSSHYQQSRMPSSA